MKHWPRNQIWGGHGHRPIQAGLKRIRQLYCSVQHFFSSSLSLWVKSWGLALSGLWVLETNTETANQWPELCYCASRLCVDCYHSEKTLPLHSDKAVNWKTNYRNVWRDWDENKQCRPKQLRQLEPFCNSFFFIHVIATLACSVTANHHD